MALIDSHAHLHFPQFDDDREAAIERARDAGLVGLINVGTDIATSRSSVQLAETHDFIYAAVGIHPHDAETGTPAALDQLRELAHHPKVVAVGEIGLDYYRDYSPRAKQHQAFHDQLQLAAELGYPVVIHSRNAHDDVLEMLEDWPGTGVLHTYAGGPSRLDRVMDTGFYIGISGPITYAKADDLRTVAGKVPHNRLLIETDCPYLAPVPHRGKRNEPAFVRIVAEAVAQARGESVERVVAATEENTRRLFGLPSLP